MAFSLTSIDPDVLSESGGVELTITGSFELDVPYRVHVGPLGTTSDPACYSGVPAQGTSCYPFSITELKCYSPISDVGSNYEVTVVDLVTLSTDQLVNAITVLPQQFGTSVYSLRKMFPTFYKTGPRSLGAE